MKSVKNYLSLIKFSHTIFAMPFAMIGFFLGLPLDFTQWRVDEPHRNLATNLGGTSLTNGGTSNYMEVGADSIFAQVRNGADPVFITIKYLVLVILCMVFARSAAMAFNRYLDRQFDAKNPRTAIREIPAGILKANSVLWFTIINCMLFITCTFFINTLCFALSPVAVLVVLGYSYTKRFTPLCHLVLGVGLSLAPIGAFLAVTGVFHWVPIMFSLAVIFWVSGFDIIYALQDEEFDKSEKLYSMPAWLGKSKALRVSEILHVLSATSVIMAGVYGHFHWLYWIGVVVFAGMLIYQHSIVKPHDLRKVNLAFMTANGIASVIFAVFVIADLFLNNI